MTPCSTLDAKQIDSAHWGLSKRVIRTGESRSRIPEPTGSLSPGSEKGLVCARLRTEFNNLRKGGGTATSKEDRDLGAHASLALEKGKKECVSRAGGGCHEKTGGKRRGAETTRL